MLTLETRPIVHPIQVGLNYVEYTISHYLDGVPDKVKVYKLKGGSWEQVDRLRIKDGGGVEEGYIPITTTGIGEVSIRVYNIGETDLPIKFVCLDLS